MTNQRDPNRRNPQDYLRRDDGNWNVLPIVIGLAILFGLGYFLFIGQRDTSPSTTTSQQQTVPKTTPAPPATTPPATTPTPPATKP